MTLARQIEQALPAWTARGRRLGLFLTLGGDESGVQFHRHNDGWNILIAGRKRWFLYPPRMLPVPAFPAEDLPIRKFSVDDPCCMSGSVLPCTGDTGCGSWLPVPIFSY